MEQFEKVCQGLECCILRDPDDEPRCDVCLYEGKCTNRLKIDALALIRQQTEKIHDLQTKIHSLKSEIHELQTKVHGLQTVQTARVMTLEEAIEAVSKDGGIVWIEQKSHPLEMSHVLPTNHICDSPQRRFQDYGKEFVPKRYSYRYMWRCWTSWPTDEQRKAVPWE